MATKAIAFKSFDEAVRKLPTFLYDGFDPLAHKTIDDLAHLVRFEIDLATEGEPNEICCRRQSDTTKALASL